MTALKKEFLAFLLEREAIRIRRAQGLPQDKWTKDPIFKKYKFTNVRRRDDYTSKRLYELYSDNKLTLPLMVYNAGVARYFGTWEFYKDVGWQTTFNRNKLEKVAQLRLESKLPVFTGAYVITNGGRSEPKQDVVCEYLQGLFATMGEISSRLAIDGWQAAHTVMRDLPGFGGSGFMGKEVLQDVLMMYPDHLLYVRDRETWTPVGPGARRGLDRVYGRPIGNAPSEERMVGEINTLREYVARPFFDKHGGEFLTAHDIQFQLCEFDKYLRVKHGEGRPRSLFKPRS